MSVPSPPARAPAGSEESRRGRHLENIQAFSQFVNAQSHGLVKWGGRSGFCVQQAYNAACDGPVGEAADQAVGRTDFESVAFLRRPATRPRFTRHPALLHILEGHGGWVTCVAATPDGRRAASGGFGGTVRLWDLATGECLKVLNCASDWVDGVGVTADGSLVVSLSSDRALRVWRAESGDCLIRLTDVSNAASFAVTPDGSRAVTAEMATLCSSGIWTPFAA